jgi:hypothetical protein
MEKHHIVITTINYPTDAIKMIAQNYPQWNLVVVGDKKTPVDWHQHNATFLSADKQSTLPMSLCKSTPFNHYARKNIGYIHAMRSGAEVIAETDDDNLPYDTYLQDLNIQVNGKIVEKNGWENIYVHFTKERVWPRGYPLEFINQSFEKSSRTSEVTNVCCPIQQYLANDNPDVDAVFRLTNPSSIKFEPTTIILHNNTYCPFNSQNTIWWKKVFPYLYLPVTVSFRMTDIWRSFIAQRCLYAHGFALAFKEATMYQIRNEHSLIRDFKDEIPGYLNNVAIMEVLENLHLAASLNSAGENLLKCYEALIRKDIIKKEELLFVKDWVHDIGLSV